MSGTHQLTFGLFCAHEQYSPTDLLQHVVWAEEAGFETIWTSDHFHPWAHTGAHAGFAWVWIASAAERTQRVKIGTAVTPPILRYNPALVAQAFATLDYMYPGRIFLTVGTGEAMNEVPIGFPWPSYKERLERLEEAIGIIRRLWKEDFITHRGKYFRLNQANLYTKPKTDIRLYVAGNGPKTAYVAGKYADGFLTLPAPREHITGTLFPALERGARDAGRDPAAIERVLELFCSYDPDPKKAVASSRFWAGALLPVFFNLGVWDPRVIESHGRVVGDEALVKNWLISADLNEHVERILDYLSMGFTHVEFLSSSPDQKVFIRTYAEKVLPEVRRRAPSVMGVSSSRAQ